MKISSVMSSPSSRSITQSMTGRPATLRRGLGTRWVCGRSRVPLPASGMITCISASTVAVLEAHEVVELGSGRLEHVAVYHRLDLVNQLGRYVYRLARLEWPRYQGIAGLSPQGELAREHVHGLILEVVVLQAEDVTGLHVQDLPHVAIGASPDELVAPGLLHPIRQVGHSGSRVGEFERRRGRDAGADTDPATDAPLGPEDRMSGFVHAERRFAHRAGFGTHPARAPLIGDAALRMEFEDSHAVPGPAVRGCGESRSGTGGHARHGGTSNTGLGRGIDVRRARGETALGGNQHYGVGWAGIGA